MNKPRTSVPQTGQPYQPNQPQPQNPAQWDPEEEGRQEQEAWMKRRQRQRGGPEPAQP